MSEREKETVEDNGQIAVSLEAECRSFMELRACKIEFEVLSQQTVKAKAVLID